MVDFFITGMIQAYLATSDINFYFQVNLQFLSKFASLRYKNNNYML